MRRGLSSLPAFVLALTVSVVSIVSVLALTACPGPAQPPPPRPPTLASEPPTVLPPPRDDGHLPALAAPLHYALAFDIDPRATTFTGTARIDVEIPAKTSHVVLNGHALGITDARALVGDVAHPARTSWRGAHGARPENSEELVLTFDPPLEPGRATLVIAYSAPFDQELSGLYRVADGGNWYAFTQFEATDARRAFPCFDEPGFKVPFDVTVTVPKGMLAFANTPEHDARGRRRQDHLPLRRHAAATDVPRGARGRRARGEGARANHEAADPTHHGQRQDRARSARARGDERPRRRARDVVRDPVPVREARHRRGAGFLGRRDGERRPRHVPRGAAPPRPGARFGAARDARKRSSSRTSSRTSGSAISSPRRGGTISG